MDNLITGLIAVAVFLAFTIGLAVSIGTLPFILIVILVAGMIITDFYQSAKAGLKDKNGEAH
jgi:hypothetical protein